MSQEILGMRKREELKGTAAPMMVMTLTEIENAPFMPTAG